MSRPDEIHFIAVSIICVSKVSVGSFLIYLCQESSGFKYKFPNKSI